jgi:hypothetical protein
MTEAGTLTKSVTSWQAERDAMLDRVSYLQDVRARTTSFVERLVDEVEPLTKFDLFEVLAILNETQVESELRRSLDRVLSSDVPSEKEDQK